jgi:hypothetical protein
LKYTYGGFKDVCKECDCAKDHRGGGCYCVKYGIIIGYPKQFCVGFEERRCEVEQVRKQENDS